MTQIALVDIDETICFRKEKNYESCKPNQKNIDKINNLYDSGWTIIYWTARGGLSQIDYYDLTLSQLKEWGCKFHELQCGPKYKPHFDLLIDDKSRRIEDLDYPTAAKK